MIDFLKAVLILVFALLLMGVLAKLTVDVEIYINLRRWCGRCVWDVIVDVACMVGLVMCILVVLFLF